MKYKRKQARRQDQSLSEGEIESESDETDGTTMIKGSKIITILCKCFIGDYAPFIDLVERHCQSVSCDTS